MKLYLTTILFLTLILSSCTSYTPEKVNARYLKLSKNLDYLMDDEINVKKRYEIFMKKNGLVLKKISLTFFKV